MTYTTKFDNIATLIMDGEWLLVYENFTEAIYCGVAPEDVKNAIETLQVFQTNLEYLPRCQYILEKSNKRFALMYSVTSIHKLVNSYWNNLLVDQQLIKMRKYIRNQIIHN